MKKISIFISFILLSTVSWGQNVPSWKLGVSIGIMEPNLQETFKFAKEAGIDYLEAGLPTLKKTDVAVIVKKISEYKDFADQTNMKIWSVHIPFGWDYDISNPDPVKREQCRQYILFSLDLAKGLGEYKKAVLHTSFEPIDSVKREMHIKALRETLKDLGPLVEKQYGIRLAIEDLPRTCLGNSSAEMLRIIEDIPSIDVCFDVNHLLGEKSEHFGEILGNRIKTVHISDYDEINERHWLPGKGVINWNHIVDVLMNAKYEGPFMFEVTKAPWNGDMNKFCHDLVESWGKIKHNYIEYSRSN